MPIESLTVSDGGAQCQRTVSATQWRWRTPYFFERSFNVSHLHKIFIPKNHPLVFRTYG